MIQVIRWLLLPISLIYQFIVWLRNKMYDYNILKSQQFSIPTIVVGNLAVGGAGKSPMTEYLIKKLKDNFKIASLSRGYGRKSKGYKLVELTSTALEVGDEPLQFKNKFPEITVAVSENRCQGINILQKENEVIILDDAFQHRQLHAGFYILLFDFKSLFKSKITLPTGDFRDILSSSKRADIIIITKCPKNIPLKDRTKIEYLLQRYTNAPILYSTIQYNTPISSNKDLENKEIISDMDVILFCGIANPSPLIDYLENLNNRVHLIQFPDHHNYSTDDFQKVMTSFDAISSNNKIIVTTEKDIQRIPYHQFNNYPLYYIPISVAFSNPEYYEILDNSFLNYINRQNSVK